MGYDPTRDLTAAARAGRRLLDLRLGWCVAQDDLLDVPAEVVAVVRAVTITSGAGEGAVSAADVSCAAPDADPAALLELARDADDAGTLLPLRTNGETRWCRYARIGRVDEPLTDAQKAAVDRAVDAISTLIGEIVVDDGPPPSARDLDGWWLLGGWLQVVWPQVHGGRLPSSALSTPTARLLDAARSAALLA